MVGRADMVVVEQLASDFSNRILTRTSPVTGSSCRECSLYQSSTAQLCINRGSISTRPRKASISVFLSYTQTVTGELSVVTSLTFSFSCQLEYLTRAGQCLQSNFVLPYRTVC